MTVVMLVVVLMLLITVGCTPVTPLDVGKSPVAPPEAFSTAGDRPVEGVWWQELDDPALQELIAMALGRNFDLRAARQRLLQAAALTWESAADMYPQLDVNGGATTSRSRTRTAGGTTTATNLLVGLAAGYEIDLWGRIRALQDGARFDELGAGEGLQAAAHSIAAEVALAWYELAEGYHQLELLRQQQKVNTVGLRLVRLRFNAGQIGIADVLQQQQLIESKSGEQSRQRAAIRQLENRLAILTGSSPGQFTLEHTPQLIDLPPLPDTGMPLALLNSRPDVKRSYYDVLAADRRVAAAIAARFPRLSIAAEANTSGEAEDLFSNWFSSLAANLVGPLIDGGKRKAEVDRRGAAAREKLYMYGQAIIDAIGEVENALKQEEEQKKLLKSLAIQLDLATKTVENVRNRYKQGAENYQRVLTARLSQQTLQRNILTARQQLISFRIALYRALGGEIPDDMIARPTNNE
jgi:NodT family efflux transporter outer membrane factor (OMF) lipoprotein